MIKTIEEIESTGEYLVLKKAGPVASFGPSIEGALKLLVLDVETTGFDPLTAEMIEIGAVLVQICPFSGRIGEVLATYNGLQEPSRSEITPAIQKVNGISPEMVKGKAFNKAQLKAMLDQADYILAHNAKFDKSFIETEFETQNKTWLCSLEGVKWEEEGYSGKKLEWLLFESKMFYKAHRALEDVYALCHLINHELKTSKRYPLQAILEAANATSYEVKAIGAPFAAKDLLKSRGFKWDAAEKMWGTSVDGEDAYQELCVFLKSEVYKKAKVGVLVSQKKGSDKYKTLPLSLTEI